MNYSNSYFSSDAFLTGIHNHPEVFHGSRQPQRLYRSRGNPQLFLAAERLHLTQPAVSKRIAALEAQLDVRLFDRLGRDVSLTEAGRALLPAPTRS